MTATNTERFGPYTVVRTVRMDNPRFPQFTVMRRDRIIGRSLSALDRGWCEFIERMNGNGGRYVEDSGKPEKYSYRFEEQRRRAGQRGGRAIKANRVFASIG